MPDIFLTNQPVDVKHWKINYYSVEPVTFNKHSFQIDLANEKDQKDKSLMEYDKKRIGMKWRINQKLSVKWKEREERWRTGETNL